MANKIKIKPGWVQLSSTRPAVKVLCRLGEETPQINGGYGGWIIEPRPRKGGVTVWNGRDPRQMNLPIMLDGFKTGKSIEGQINDIERLALPTADREPPRVTIAGPGLMHTDLIWLINNIDWGTALFDEREKGTRTRQSAVLTLLAYAAPDRLQTGGAAAQARRLASQDVASGTSGDTGGSTYVVKQSDLKHGLSGIAAAKLGDSKRWKEIAKLNDIRDPMNIKVGQKLRMPAR